MADYHERLGNVRAQGHVTSNKREEGSKVFELIGVVKIMQFLGDKSIGVSDENDNEN